MATKIPTEILIKILKNFKSSGSTRDLYSSLLVNRLWCKVTIPILWELPLGQNYYWWDRKKMRKNALCIRTYISCMDTQARNLLIQNGFDLSSSPPQAIFDYPSFTHKLIIVNLGNFVSIYSQQIIGPDHGTIYEYRDLIISILKLPGAPEVFKKLESFTSTIEKDHICPLYESLILICDNILNLELSLNSYSQVQLLPKLINVQKRLENLSIFSNGYLECDCDSLFWAIISQKETLKSLRLKSINLNRFEENSSPIGQFISLQELSIVGCSFHKSVRLSLASSFTQLSSFHYSHSRLEDQKYSQEFIIKILETANINLKKIYLDLYPITFDTISAILNYCSKITELTLLNLSREQVITIFKNNFNELKRFSTDCGIKIFDTELLCQMAENVIESLETIEIIMVYPVYPRTFNTNGFDSLRKFFEGWCCKGGGNKNVIVKRQGKRLFTLSDDEEHRSMVYKIYGIFDIVLYDPVKIGTRSLSHLLMTLGLEFSKSATDSK
ncbi:10587_t:CDS:2 [Diversispora eburnea]|uniref:10587_t:CDS:1 n=1 Tax=Diversispora eburnea TaxID=1213867 RepID=A0A9N9FBX9_9GLOM|nr:10587_t:CDS:2 [Diversispora eburnea]